MRCIATMGIIASLGLLSCSKTTDCKTPELDALVFTPDTGIIQDGRVLLLGYERGSNFTKLVHDYNMQVVPKGRSIQVEFTHMVRPHETDWKVTLQPSGRTYLVKDISFTNDHIKQPALSKKEVTCINKVSYTVNDVVKIYDPGEPTSFNITASLPITY